MAAYLIGRLGKPGYTGPGYTGSGYGTGIRDRDTGPGHGTGTRDRDTGPGHGTGTGIVIDGNRGIVRFSVQMALARKRDV